MHDQASFTTSLRQCMIVWSARKNPCLDFRLTFRVQFRQKLPIPNDIDASIYNIAWTHALSCCHWIRRKLLAQTCNRSCMQLSDFKSKAHCNGWVFSRKNSLNHIKELYCAVGLAINMKFEIIFRRSAIRSDVGCERWLMTRTWITLS